jgi:hypothetical protein
MRGLSQGWSLALVLGSLLLGGFVGCGDSPPPVRSRDEIFSEQMELPALYFTESGKKIRAKAGQGAFVDAGSGETWSALACNRPDCPGRKSADEPFLFISPDPAMYVAEGKIAFDPERAKNALPHGGQCPECWKQRNRASETNEQQQQFRDWVAPYVLPETAERLAQLEVERKRRARRQRHESLSGTGATTSN